MKRYDPDTHLFSEVCKSLVGAKIRLNYTIELLNGDRFTNTLNNCNVVGDCLENVLFPFLKRRYRQSKKDQSRHPLIFGTETESSNGN